MPTGRRHGIPKRPTKCLGWDIEGRNAIRRPRAARFFEADHLLIISASGIGDWRLTGHLRKAIESVRQANSGRLFYTWRTHQEPSAAYILTDPL